MTDDARCPSQWQVPGPCLERPGHRRLARRATAGSRPHFECAGDGGNGVITHLPTASLVSGQPKTVGTVSAMDHCRIKEWGHIDRMELSCVR